MSLRYLPEHAAPALLALNLNLLPSADAFIAARKLRNALVHEYMHDAQTFLESLLAAQEACGMFFRVIHNAQAECMRLGLPTSSSAHCCPCA